MKYYTRNFHNNILPYNLIDEFTIYDEASLYDDEFYNSLIIEHEKKLKSYGMGQSVHSLFFNANAVKLLSILAELPLSIKIPDTRTFLLYVISPELHGYITDLNEKQNIMIHNKLQEIENRYNEDKKVMPKHWLALYTISWFDSVLKITESRENELLLFIKEGYSLGLRHTILLRGVSNVYKEREYDISRIIFTEILYEDSSLILNIMTNSNEYSFKAHDITILQPET